MTFPIISSNTLFHFTSKRDYLISILKNNFRPRYCLEDLTCLMPDALLPDLINIAIPMTCFCDIPLSNIGKHLNTYGKYGIGLTKKWGMKKGLNPILYVHKDSDLWKTIDENDKAILKYLNDGPASEEIIRGISTLRFNYLKPYEGNFPRNGEIIPNVRFYDEREWRFVPPSPNGEYYRLKKMDFDDLTKRQSSNDSLPESATLEFTPDDIRYIIVERESEILETMDKIMELKGEHYTYNQVKLLQTRIISAEQIQEDF